MKTNKMFRILLMSATFVFFSVSFFGCSKEGPFAPGDMESESGLSSIKRTSQDIKFLTAKTISLKKVAIVEQLITVANGGMLETGDDKYGFSSVTFNPGDVSDDVVVKLELDTQNFAVEFSPHGITFNQPVRVRISYKDADLNGIDEDNLKIWYYNEAYDIWEFYGSIVNKEAKYVEGITRHFSKYIVGGE